MADANSGTYSWSLVITVYASAAMESSTTVRKEQFASLYYTPLLPGGRRLAHMVMGGFSAELRSADGAQVMFAHQAPASGLGLVADEEEQKDDTSGTTKLASDSAVTGTNQFAQRLSGSPSGTTSYIQWISPYFDEMHVSLLIPAGRAFAKGEPICVLILGQFGQPGFVQAKRFGSIMTVPPATGGVPFVAGYKIAPQDPADIGHSMALTPTFDTRSLHRARSTSPWTSDDAIVSLAINTGAKFYDFWGLFFYNVLDNSPNHELFKVMVCPLGPIKDAAGTDFAAGSGVGRTCVLARPPDSSAALGPLNVSSELTSPVTSTSWDSSLMFKCAWGKESSIASTDTFTAYPWLSGGKNSVDSTFSGGDRINPNVHGGDGRWFDLVLAGATYGGMVCAVWAPFFSASRATPRQNMRIQIMPSSFAHIPYTVTATNPTFRRLPDSPDAVAAKSPDLSIGGSAHLNMTNVAALFANHKRAGAMPGPGQAIKLGPVTGAWDQPGANMIVAASAPGAVGALARSAARFMLRLGNDCDGGTGSRVSLSFSPSSKSCVVPYVAPPPAWTHGAIGIPMVGADVAFAPIPSGTYAAAEIHRGGSFFQTPESGKHCGSVDSSCGTVTEQEQKSASDNVVLAYDAFEVAHRDAVAMLNELQVSEISRAGAIDAPLDIDKCALIPESRLSKPICITIKSHVDAAIASKTAGLEAAQAGLVPVAAEMARDIAARTEAVRAAAANARAQMPPKAVNMTALWIGVGVLALIVVAAGFFWYFVIKAGKKVIDAGNV